MPTNTWPRAGASSPPGPLRNSDSAGESCRGASWSRTRCSPTAFRRSAWERIVTRARGPLALRRSLFREVDIEPHRRTRVDHDRAAKFLVGGMSEQDHVSSRVEGQLVEGRRAYHAAVNHDLGPGL